MCSKCHDVCIYVYVHIHLFVLDTRACRGTDDRQCAHSVTMCVYIYVCLLICFLFLGAHSTWIRVFVEAQKEGNVLIVSWYVYMCIYTYLCFCFSSETRICRGTYSWQCAQTVTIYIYIYVHFFFFRYACLRRLIEKAMCSNCHELASGPLAGWCWVMARCAAMSTILVLYIYVYVCEYI